MTRQTTSQPRTHNDYTVGWVCALPKELVAAAAMLDETHPDLPRQPKDHNVYTLGNVGGHNVVVACLPKGDVSNNNSATVAARMTSTFPSIRFGLMVGIGGGAPKSVRLGDVVVSTPTDGFGGVVQWDLGKTEHGGTFKRTGALNRPPGELLAALAKLEKEHTMKGSKIPQYLKEVEENWPKLAPKYTRSESLKDVLFKADYKHVKKPVYNIDDSANSFENVESEDDDQMEDREEGYYCINCNQSEIVRRKPRDMRVHYGLIVSGNQVIKDANFRDEINKRFDDKVLCFEMEAAGMINILPCMVIRGICDYADSHKNNAWQEYAAAVAAAFAKEFLSTVPAQEVQQMPTIKVLLRIEGRLEGVSKVVNELHSRQRNIDEQGILDWLTLIDYASQQSDYLGRRQPGTGQWLLDLEEYQNWLNTSKQTLFSPGIPGAGKTILTSIIVNDLYERFQDDASIGIAYLYCNFRRQGEQRVEDLVASLLKQLSQESVCLPDGVKALYKRHGKRTRPSSDEIFKALLSVAAMFSRVFIIIDALDECQVSDGCRATFMSQLLNLQASTRVNLFVTSRFLPEITKKFEGSTIIEIRASEEDVRRYLDSNMYQLPGFIVRSLELQEEVKTRVVQSVDGMFLLTQLHFDSLIGKTSLKALRTTLKKLPTGTEAYNYAYEDVMKRINNQASDQKELAKQVLAWVTYAKRPLTISELRHALAVETGESELDEENIPEIEDIVSECAGLVTVDEESDVVRLVHYTTQEYFGRTQMSWFPNGLRDITTTCVTYLSFDAFETGSCLSDEEFAARLRFYSLYDYAARNWGHHARVASAVDELVMDFLQSGFKVSSSYQAMIASGRYLSYSQDISRRMIGVHLAAHFGLKEAMSALLKNGYELEIRDNVDQTPLSIAAAKGHEALVELLLEKGAKLETKDKIYGRTPLLWAIMNGHEVVVKLLLEKGARLEFEDKTYSQTPLSWAIMNGHEVVVKLLLAKGARLETKNIFGQTPLLWAASEGYEAIVKLLLEKGAKLDTQNDLGRTPLLLALVNGHEEIAMLLLEKGAKVDTQDIYGWTPLSWAVSEQYEAIAKLLREKGAKE